MHIKEVNDDLRTLFDLIYNNLIPKPIQQLFTDTYTYSASTRTLKTSLSYLRSASHLPSDASLHPMSPRIPSPALHSGFSPSILQLAPKEEWTSSSRPCNFH
mmetsp:Transcript_12758/g.23514  ORF Transcript_12758/g.23514 Transcript_12758/m.23514 type:complete len:102 (+) Transcript_12758:70-375(+)